MNNYIFEKNNGAAKMMNAKNKTINSSIFDKIYFCFFLFLPLVYANRVVDPVLVPRQLYLTIFLFIIAIVICYKVRQKKLQPDFSFLKLPVFIAEGLFLLTILISFFQSIAITESIYLFSKMLIEVVFFIATTYLLIRKELSTSWLIKSIIAFAALSMIIVVYQVLDLQTLRNDFFDNMLRVNATFGHKNLLASILFLSIPFLLNTSGYAKGWKFLAISTIFLSIITVWLLQTKAVVASLLIFFVILLFFIIKQQKQRGNKRFIKLVLISAALLLGFASIITIQNRQKFPRLFDKNSSFERLGLWDNSRQMIQEHIILGVGAGNWQIHFPKYGLDKFATAEVKNGITTFQRPHNDFLWILSEMGIVGLLAYISVFVLIFYYLIKLLRKQTEAESGWLYATFFAALICYVVIACVDFPLERIEHQLIMYILFSIGTAHFYLYVRPATVPASVLKFSTTILLFVPVLFSFVISYNRYIGEYHTQRLYGFERGNNWIQMNKEAEKAMNVCYSMDPMSAPIQWYKGVALFSMGDLEAAKMSFETAYILHPYNIHVINNLASCYESLKDHKKAEEFYLKALNISPGFEEARLNLSAVYYNTKQYEKAFEVIDKCDINTKDEKYQLFLPAILSSWLDMLILHERNEEAVRKLTDIKNTENGIMMLYVASKKKGVNFKGIYNKLTNN